MTAGYTRSRNPSPGGIDGGLEEIAQLCRSAAQADGSSERLRPSHRASPVDTDDVIRIHTGAGGGAGDPKKRETARASAEDIPATPFHHGGRRRADILRLFDLTAKGVRT